ncbi:hypothetical protein D8674_016028 [Pyrus ussuriensis x Pyrus communis]|uniref:Uncharacterized protein n=1 Tax=Pyrus ussuriensis x Pyrus communis TaxID=2448454 RepID=A0A5N5H9T5_9ROSA|nr:hypothetical protein D8674_016028 [Pyrus ussuriensis x Pyrus communis]
MIVSRAEPSDVQSTERNQLANMHTNKSRDQEAAAGKLQVQTLPRSNTKPKNEISGGKTATNQETKRKERAVAGGVWGCGWKGKNVESSKGREQEARGREVRRRGMLERGGRGCHQPKPKQGTGG